MASYNDHPKWCIVVVIVLRIASFEFATCSLDRHVSRFIIVESANQFRKRLDLSTLLGALIDATTDLYAPKSTPYTNWNALMNAILAKFCPRSFVPRVLDRIMTIKMKINEEIVFYCTRTIFL